MIIGFIKRSLKIITFILILFSSSDLLSTNIKFEIENTEEKNIFFCMYKGPDYEIVDTLFLNNGVFSYISEKALPHGVYFAIVPPFTKFDFIIADDQDFTLKVDLKNITKTIESTGEEQYTLFLDMQKSLADLNKMRSQLNMEKEIFKQIKKDTLPVINKMIDSINNVQVNIYKNLESQLKPHDFFYKMLKIIEPFEIPDTIENLKYENPEAYFRYYADHYLDRVDFSDESLLNTPQFVFHRLLEEYCYYFFDLRIKHLEEVYSGIDNLIARTDNNRAFRKYILDYLLVKYEKPEDLRLEAIFVHIYRKYYMNPRPDWISDQAYDILKFRAESMQNNVISYTGKDLELPDIEGKYQSIYKLNSEYKVLLFWEPDCDFCTDMTMELRDVYNDLESINTQVYAVYTGLDTKIWEDFINEHELMWINVYDPERNSNFELYYGTFKTPRLYVLDKNNIIITKDIKPESIIQFINKYESENGRIKDNFEFIFGN